MFDENNFSNDNSYEQNNSQAVPGGSVAAHTDNNNGQAAGKATGNYSGVNPGSGQSGPGEPYTSGYGNTGQGAYGNGPQGTYQAGGYQNGGYQNTGYQSGSNGQPNGNYSGYGSYQSNQGHYQYGSRFSENDYGTVGNNGPHGKKKKEKKPGKGLPN